MSLLCIPGVGPSIAADLGRLGIREVAELRGQNPESLYAELCEHAGKRVDRCVLYVFRCAAYFASTAKHDPEKLKWWNWKDRGLIVAERGHGVQTRRAASGEQARGGRSQRNQRAG